MITLLVFYLVLVTIGYSVEISPLEAASFGAEVISGLINLHESSLDDDNSMFSINLNTDIPWRFYDCYQEDQTNGWFFVPLQVPMLCTGQCTIIADSEKATTYDQNEIDSKYTFLYKEQGAEQYLCIELIEDHYHTTTYPIKIKQNIKVNIGTSTTAGGACFQPTTIVDITKDDTEYYSYFAKATGGWDGNLFFKGGTHIDFNTNRPDSIVSQILVTKTI